MHQSLLNLLRWNNESEHVKSGFKCEVFKYNVLHTFSRSLKPKLKLSSDEKLVKWYYFETDKTLNCATTAWNLHEFEGHSVLFFETIIITQFIVYAIKPTLSITSFNKVKLL